MTLLDKFIDPELIKQLPFGEKITGSVYVSLLGMALTFVVLVIVCGFVILLSRLAGKRAGGEKTVSFSAPPVPPELKIEEEEELVAAISAALAAASPPPAAIRVKEIVRTEDDTPAWGRMGRIEQLNQTIS
jgi:Na+-transporting methylmalonyl-CoA/oxaloacetate decarboxylase gamma subunit